MALHQKQYKGYIIEDGNVTTWGCATVSAVDVDKEEVVLNRTCHLKCERIWATLYKPRSQQGNPPYRAVSIGKQNAI